MREHIILALDIGATSGRGILGYYDADRKLLKMEEVHRFPNHYVRIRGGIYWDYISIYNGILDCLRVCKSRGIDLACIAIDTWAQDYAYIGHGGQVLSLPRSYRDPNYILRSEDLEKDLALDEKEFYLHRGGTYCGIATVRQLYYDRRFQPELFNSAKYFVNMPYLFVYLLTDVAGYDVTFPAMGEGLDVKTMDVSTETATAVGYAHLIPPRFHCGTIMGHTNRTVFEATGYDAIPVACIDAHDTNSAVNAIPDTDDFLWISSGTSNMFGAVIPEPVLNDALYNMNGRITPMGDGRTCIQCGAAGMYYINLCMDYWKKQGLDVSYEKMTAYSLDHNSDVWFDFEDIPSAPTNMPAEICKAIEKQGFPAPETPEDLYVAFANSLAKNTADLLLQLENALGKEFGHIYVMSGGSKAAGINARIAKLTGKKLYTGLTEAASVGNLLFQLVALGLITRNEAAEVSRNSFKMQEFYA